MEGLSGTKHNDILTGSEITAAERLPLAQGGSEGFAGSALDAQGIALINGLQAVLGVTSFSAGDIILGGDGNDLITGLAGDDIIDGDKWLDVQIGVFAANDPNHTGTPIALHNSMTTLAASMFAGTINPGQLGIVRTIREDTTNMMPTIRLKISTPQSIRACVPNNTFAGNADGSLQVTHAIEDQLDGSKKLRNIERLQFSDGGALNIVVGTTGNDTALNGTADDDLILGLAGNDTLNGFAGN